MRAESVGRWGLRVAGSAGLAAFAFFFFLTWHTPAWVENFAREYIATEVAQRVDARLDALSAPPAVAGDGVVQRLAAEVYAQNQARIDEIKARLKDRTRDLFLAALDQVRELDCSCRERIEIRWHELNLAQLAALAIDNERIAGIIHDGYMSVVHELQHEIRIFTGINALAFLLLLLVSFAKPAASRHLLFPGVLLLAATMFCAWLYVFSQDWLLTLIHGDYVGWAYGAYLALVSGFLADIALNRGRVTSAIGNGAGSMLGSAASFTPC